MLRHRTRLGILVVATLLLVCSQQWAAATPLHNFHCNNCHLAVLSIAQLGNGNVCLKCHNPTASDVTLNAGAPPILDGHTDGRFTSGDASNAFGHGNGLPGGDQTSHNWAVATDTIPSAGAQAPARTDYPQFYSRYGTSSGKLTCTRCHNPHETAETNPKLLVLGNNSADTMCRACHLPWDQADNRGLMTHPLVTDYNAKASAAPEKYRTTLLNKDNADIRLVGGGVSCTSCHDVHFADSDAATVDGATSLLSQSDGKVLRGDGPGQADKSSLCQTCHIYQNHGDETGERPGCLVCHSGHVYDPSLPNYFVLRKSATTATYNTVTGLNYSSPAVLNAAQKYTFWNDRTNGTANGYCEKCHGDAQDINAAEYHVTNAVCTNCHKHDNQLGGFSANCGACHGNSATQASWPDGIANNVLPAYAWADDAGSHAVHVAAIGTRNLSCTACHPGNPPVDHYLDVTTGVQQAEVTRMDTNGDGAADFWRYLEGATAGSGTAVYFQTVSGADDTDAYFQTGNKTCSNIDCHGGLVLKWGTAGDCLSCHALPQGSRAAIVGQFAANSHHVQGTALTANHCYQCHWEANNNGTINPAYHGGVFNSGAEVDLVIYGAGARPSAYTAGTTAVPYLADGSRNEVSKLNAHCLGCHSDQNSATTPFNDGKTPKAYAWDGTSVASRYSQSGTTPWGKYTDTASTFITPKATRTKAYSAHGNTVANQGGFDLAETWPNTRNGNVNVACYDCHNSHGSTVAGTTTSYNSATTNGGLLKATQAGRGGYAVNYQPVAGGSAVTDNQRNAGASLCFDCHMNAAGGSTQPWGYQATFGASQQIMGYFDTPYLAPGDSGPQLRYTYRQNVDYQGGHFGASAPLDSTPMGTIKGLCTPCHDPHGVSSTLGANKPYGVPLLKGTWLTSPYPEDVAPPYATSTYQSGVISNAYHIDQNTFGTNINMFVVGITETEAQFAGLCLQCHPKASLTDGVTHTWKSKDRIHESVKGWKTANATVKHRYSCSKCHTPHMGSSLPRLMVTNCLDSYHKGRTPGTPYPSLEGFDDWGDPTGRIPGGGFSTCHNGPSANNGNDNNLDHSWNLVTPWYAEPPLAITAGPTTITVDNVGSNVRLRTQWTTNVLSDSVVEYGPTIAYGSSVNAAALVTSHDQWIQNLVNHATTHYRVRSTSFAGQSTASVDKPVYISFPPSVPGVLAEPDNNLCGASCAATLDWNASTDPIDNGSIEYYAELSTSAAFSPVLYNSGWLATTHWNTATLTTNKAYYWRVKSRDAGYTTINDPNSAWSATDLFNLTDGTPPAITLVNPVSANYAGYDGYYPMNFQWSTTRPGQYQVQVSTDPTFTSVGFPSGWIENTSWVAGLTHPSPGTTTYYWRVQGKLSNGTAGAWSAVRSFIITDYGASSCPLVFGWTGAGFDYISDLAGPVIGLKPTTTDRSVTLFHPEVAALNGLVPDGNGRYRVKIRESLPEITYLDTASLLAIDAPAGYEVHTSWAETTYVYGYASPFQIYTARDPLSPTAAYANDGTNVLASLLAIDNAPAYLDPDALDFYYTIDFGSIGRPQYAKLLIDGWTLYGDSSLPAKPTPGTFIQPYIEVADQDGFWVRVKEFGTPAGDLKTMVVDLSNLFISDDHRIRIHTGMRHKSRWLIDRIRLDQSVPVSVSVQELPATTATLKEEGNAIQWMSSLVSRIIASDISLPVDWSSSPSFGNFTRYGEVTDLLTDSDDKFAIMRQGDTVELTFTPVAPPPDGYARSFVIKSDLFYKSLKVANRVEPLPFHGMSSFPYPDTENYPSDPEHVQYLLEYNTRTYE